MKEPLLLLPGHMCDARLFSHQINRLCRVAGLHLPKVPDGESIRNMAVDILADAPPRFAVAGLSMGGIVAMEIYRIAPERVTRIALMDTNHLPESKESAAERKVMMTRVKRGHFREVVRDELKPQYMSNGSDNRPNLNVIMDMALSLGPDVFIRQSRAINRRRDQSGTLRSLNVPAWIMCGERDTLCPVERHREIAALIPKARLEVIPGAGHLPTLEQPEIANQKLIEWMEIEA